MQSDGFGNSGLTMRYVPELCQSSYYGCRFEGSLTPLIQHNDFALVLPRRFANLFPKCLIVSFGCLAFDTSNDAISMSKQLTSKRYSNR